MLMRNAQINHQSSICTQVFTYTSSFLSRNNHCPQRPLLGCWWSQNLLECAYCHCIAEWYAQQQQQHCNIPHYSWSYVTKLTPFSVNHSASLISSRIFVYCIYNNATLLFMFSTQLLRCNQTVHTHITSKEHHLNTVIHHYSYLFHSYALYCVVSMSTSYTWIKSFDLWNN